MNAVYLKIMSAAGAIIAGVAEALIGAIKLKDSIKELDGDKAEIEEP